MIFSSEISVADRAFVLNHFLTIGSFDDRGNMFVNCKSNDNAAQSFDKGKRHIKNDQCLQQIINSRIYFVIHADDRFNRHKHAVDRINNKVIGKYAEYCHKNSSNQGTDQRGPLTFIPFINQSCRNDKGAS